MSQLPVQMRDRWLNRTEASPGTGTIYWHILLGGNPDVRSIAQSAQERLAQFEGLHMTPLDWLHMTVLVTGSTTEITHDQMETMVALASDSLADVAPVTVKLGPVLYHPEAIMLGVHPQESLRPVLRAAQAATRTVTDRAGRSTSGPGEWVPHMTLCYSTANQPARPLIESLGLALPEREVTISALTLVVQWDEERQWKWQPVASIPLGGAAPE
ncbi:2'-5' RNA ligase family protein [Spirillospora sp. NPDC048911]|uniref:2'-5' RNA ligase family protein n=1 Tax=Spirillospora sp. NPDC048911 TaxID=3364527 RepID=UPI00371BFDA7